jgi:hypothetical protein
MVSALARRDSLTWLSPSPTWGDVVDLAAPDQRKDFARPAILRFAHDRFMEELTGALAYQPEKLGEWRAQPETWEKPMHTPPSAAGLLLPEPVSKLSTKLARRAPRPAADDTDDVDSLPRPLKLYQPIQMRHYLITASLVCQRPGLPDRHIDPAKQEKASYVLRRIVMPQPQDPGAPSAAPSDDPASWDEYAFVHGPGGPRWQQVAGSVDRADQLLAGEERLPMFSLGFDDQAGRKRRLFGGVIPVGRREAYLAATIVKSATVAGEGSSPAPGAGTGNAAAVTAAVATDPRLLLFHVKIAGPWSELLTQAQQQQTRFADVPGPFLGTPLPTTTPPTFPAPQAVSGAKNQAQTISWYTLLDFEQFLLNHLPRLHQALQGTLTRTDLDALTERPLWDWLGSVTPRPTLSASDPTSLREALQEFATHPTLGDGLEAVDTPYSPDPSGRPLPQSGWPTFLFPLVDATPGVSDAFPFLIGGATVAPDQALQTLVEKVTAALPPVDSVPTPLPDIPLHGPRPFDSRPAWFAIRCVYERPNCGPLDPALVSVPTQPFQMAGHFDPEAPVRPARIPLPFDISPAGLRKFNRGTMLMVSDMLCGQLKKIRALTLGDLVLSVLPWPFHKPLPSIGDTGPCETADHDALGMFCSLSIPIVTLCALILLLIIVTLFDYFFRWLPYLFICFPIPGLKGKRK